VKKECIVVDLEGTLSNCDHRKHFLDKKNYDVWNKGLPMDKPIQPMIDFVSKLSEKYEIIISTAKPHAYRCMVEDWLEKYCPAFSGCQILMRIGGSRTSPEIKSDHIIAIQESYEIMLFIDDRFDVLEMVAKKGVQTLLATHDYDFNEAWCYTMDGDLIPEKGEGEKKTVADFLRESADIFEERNKAYGGSYKDFGNIMKALFPDGIHIDSAEDMNRFGVLHMMVSKLHRYCGNFDKGGHADSLTDLSTYSGMLNELDSTL